MRKIVGVDYGVYVNMPKTVLSGNLYLEKPDSPPDPGPEGWKLAEVYKKSVESLYLKIEVLVCVLQGESCELGSVAIRKPL